MQAAFDAAHYAATDHHDPQDAFDDTGRVPLDDEEGMFEARAREDVSSLAQPALAPPVVSHSILSRWAYRLLLIIAVGVCKFVRPCKTSKRQP